MDSSIFLGTLGFLLLFSQSSVLADERSEFLNAHNSARAAIPVGSLTWSDAAASYALNWATTLRDQRGCNMIHSNSGGKYGENLYKWWGSSGATPPKPGDAVKAWVDEKKDYNYATNTCATGKVCGHYTQVVWRNTKRVGCAYVRCPGNAVLVSCNYDPPGNWIGERPYLNSEFPNNPSVASS